MEVPLGGFVKRSIDGELDYISPIPSPFNYGCAPAHLSGDGMPLDVVLLGPRRARGHTERVRVLAVVHFIDAGEVDTKMVVARRALTAGDVWRVRAFFMGYARWKAVLNWARQKSGATRLDGVEVLVEYGG